ncbi:MAG: germination protein YpeB [Clostridiales bacterium]|nr:germination protein YpeB [Clostridiales bacterium]
MEKRKVFHRRSLIRAVSFAAAVMVALSAAAISGYAAARKNRNAMEYSYQRALSELNEYVSNITVALDKGKYAATPKQLQSLSGKLWRETGSAKSALSQLPVAGEEMAATYKFLSQLGSFCVTLSNRVADGGSITEEEAALFRQLSQYAEEVSDRLALMESQVENGSLELGEVQAAMQTTGDAPAERISGLDEGFREMEEGFEDYPTLIYDGPFSDHVLQQRSKLLDGMEEMGMEPALALAEKLTGVSGLRYAGETGGNLPCHRFETDGFTVSMTKAGGALDYFLNSREIGEATLTPGQAQSLAVKALSRYLEGEFKPSYYSINGGVLTANFAAVQDDVTLYPDLVKVGVAMDTGDIVSYDGRGYLMNHTVRSLPAPSLSREQARETVSPLLSVTGEGLAVVPGDGLSEKLCYEFACTGEEGENVLVYIDVQTGMEEQILILLEDEGGTLVI